MNPFRKQQYNKLENVSKTKLEKLYYELNIAHEKIKRLEATIEKIKKILGEN